ncbi:MULTISPECIES: phage tail spike protein [unclassified Bacillus (in: firmicutes)]|uniref:phage tail spike protein n=1 Tax=unclassified Bacillus (in: firmicutes) TaxID=185979 RepID=UPI001BEA2A43|nr:MULTISPECIES: phage tail spike protein [unclassified Bacillus (in: firmicutes)]MBT2614118.1 phage tail protein [Bacillus sp. ISL-78]MBT2629371.1 phage tail protein [Bacillus sp. ISL-101]
MFLTVTDLTGITEPLYDVKTPKRIEEVNGDYSLSLLIFNSERNAHAYPLVKEESLIEHKGVEYRIKNVNEQNIGSRSMKTITAQHTMFDLIDHFVYETLTGTRTLKEALDFIFKGTGYTFSITDIFPSEDVGEDFGNDNGVSLLQKALEIFQAEYDISGTHFTFAEQIGNKTDTQFRYKHNIKAINKSTDSNGISTYIKGYGKLKEEKDVLSGNSIPYASRSGTYYTDPGLNQLATEKVGANFKFSFVGTGFNFKTIVTFLGGVWEFTIDGSQSVKISTYQDVVSKDKTIEIIRGLENKSHSVVATFKGKDAKNPYTKLKSDPAPIVYLKSGNIIGLYRELVGDEQYTVTAEYVSPNASKFPNPFSEDGYKHADPVYDERITNKTTLLNKLKKSIQDEPEVSITVDFVDLRNAGYPYQHPNKGDEILLIYEPMNLDINVRIMRIEEEEDAKGNIINCAVTLANFGKSASSVMTSFSQTSKRISRILTDDDKLKYDFLDEAVKRATAALQSAQTELEFNNGLIAREKTNPNELVLFNSQGIGISTDGGQTFRTAMTAEGIVADAITTGTLRAIIIEGVEIYGSMFETSDNSDDFIRIEKNQLRSHGRYTRTWDGVEETALLNLGIRNGQMWVSNEETGYNLYFTERGLSTTMAGATEGLSSGTLEFHSQRFNQTSRGVTLHSTYGAVSLLSEYSTIFTRSRLTNNIESEEYSVYIRPYLNTRAGINEFRFFVKDNPSGYDTDGVLGYGNYSGESNLGSGIRFDKDAAIIYATNINGDMGSGVFSASEFRNSSSIIYKTNIEDLNVSGLNIINNLELKQYVLQSDVDHGIYNNWQVGVISELSPEVATSDGLSVNMYKLLSYAVKAIQELSIKVDVQQQQITDYEVLLLQLDRNQEQKIISLEEIISELKDRVLHLEQAA